MFFYVLYSHLKILELIICCCWETTKSGDFWKNLLSWIGLDIELSKTKIGIIKDRIATVDKAFDERI